METTGAPQWAHTTRRNDSGGMQALRRLLQRLWLSTPARLRIVGEDGNAERPLHRYMAQSALPCVKAAKYHRDWEVSSLSPSDLAVIFPKAISPSCAPVWNYIASIHAPESVRKKSVAFGNYSQP
jgi:hypothetical protein